MSDTQPDLNSLLLKCLALHYPDALATTAVQLYGGSEEFKVYIVGCLLLTLTASVHPQYTLLTSRQRSLVASLPGCSEAQVAHLAAAGLYAQDASRLVCFHCSAKLPAQALLSSTTSSSPSPSTHGLDSHRAASPNCYYVRFFDFIVSHGSEPRLGETIPRDVVRYVKALRKLRTDLACRGMAIAASYGYTRQALGVSATRHFMRNSGRLPDRAGDLIELVHQCELLLDAAILATVDVPALLETPKLLGPVTQGGASASGGASSGGAAAGARTESGYHSIVIGRYDQSSGSWESSSQSVTNEQVRQLEAVLGPLPRGSLGGGGGASSSSSSGPPG